MDLHVKDQFLIRTAYEDYLNDTEKYKLVLSTTEIDRLQERIERSNRSQLGCAILGILVSPIVAWVLPILLLVSLLVLLIQNILRTQLVKNALNKWWILLAKGWHTFSSDVPLPS